MHSRSPLSRVFLAGATSIALSAHLLVAPTHSWSEESKDPTPTPKVMSATFVNSMGVLNDSHVLGPGDQLSFRVIEDEDPPKLLTVTASGEMEVPYLGRVTATGKSCKAVAYEIKTALEKDFYYQASVILELDVAAPKGIVSRGRIYLMGQVRSQGPQEIPADEVYTVSKAVLRAGGFAEYANKRKVKVIRKVGKSGDTETKIVDLVEVLEKGKASKDLAVEPDDLIVVPERLINF